MREKREKKKELEARQDFDENIIGIVEKISMRRIQWHQERSLMVIGVGHISNSKTSELWYFWTTSVAHFVNRLWPFMGRYIYLFNIFFYDISDVFIRVLVCFRDLFTFFLFYFFTNYKEERRKRKKQRKKTLNVHRNFDNDITSTI